MDFEKEKSKKKEKHDIPPKDKDKHDVIKRKLEKIPHKRKMKEPGF